MHPKQPIENPQESLDCEIKDWIDLNSDSDKSTLIKACFALYNYGGGNLVIGLKNETHELSEKYKKNYDNISKLLHIDEVQKIISKYSSKKIEVTIDLRQYGQTNYKIPIVKVPPGVKTPVWVKKNLEVKDDKKSSLNEGQIYMRTLEANGKVSSVNICTISNLNGLKVGNSLETLIERCFNNREADIAGFVRRHFTLEQINLLKSEFCK